MPAPDSCPLCRVCDRPMRPHHADPADYPGTVRAMSFARGLCTACAKQEREYATPEVPFPPLGRHACGEPDDPELFFPHESDPADEAKAVCAVCPVRRECLAFALTHQVEGVWGGTTTAERRSLRRRHRIATFPFDDWRTA